MLWLPLMPSAALVTAVGCVVVVGVAIAFSARAADATARTLRFNAALAVTGSVGLAAMALLLVTVEALVLAVFVALLALACCYAAVSRVRELREASPPSSR